MTLKLTFNLLIALILFATACQSDPPTITYEEVESLNGDAGSGEKIFAQGVDGAPSCASCHALDQSRLAGPGLGGFGQRAGSQVANVSGEEFAFYSIIEPGRHVTQGFSNVMYNQYDEVFEPLDVADLIAYLLQL